MRKITPDALAQAVHAHLNAARQQPIAVDGVVLLSEQEYERLLALEDAYWGERANRAKAEGHATPEEVQRLLDRLSDEAA